MRRVAVLAVAVAAVASIATSCGSDDDAEPAATASSSVPTDTTPSTVADSVEEPATTASPTTAAPTTVPTTTAAPTTAPPTTAAPTTAAPTTLPPFPPSLTELPDPPDVWSVVLAGSTDFDDPVLAQAVADAEAAGYFVGPTDCDEGAAEAIGIEGNGVYTITVYLNSEADARAAADAFAARGIPATVALVTLFCLD